MLLCFGKKGLVERLKLVPEDVHFFPQSRESVRESTWDIGNANHYLWIFNHLGRGGECGYSIYWFGELHGWCGFLPETSVCDTKKIHLSI